MFKSRRTGSGFGLINENNTANSPSTINNKNFNNSMIGLPHKRFAHLPTSSKASKKNSIIVENNYNPKKFGELINNLGMYC